MPKVNQKERTIILTKEITRGIEKLNLPYSTLKGALDIAEELLGKKIGKKFSPKVFAAAILYTACLEDSHPILMKEICKAIGLNKKEQRKSMEVYSMIAQKIRKVLKPSMNKYIERLIDSLGLNDNVKTKALQIIEDAKQRGLTSGRNPISIAAAAIYIAAKKLKISITQKEIASKAHITEVTLRNRYKELLRIIEGKDKFTTKKRLITPLS
jgi:transcription initiation factor TFIIB